VVPEPTLLLELHRDLAGRVPGVAELGDGVDVGAAAEAAVGDQALQPVEVAEDLLARRGVGRCELLEAGRQVGGDQRVLGRVVVVQRPLAHPGLGRYGVDADGANPLRVEELVGGG